MLNGPGAPWLTSVVPPGGHAEHDPLLTRQPSDELGVPSDADLVTAQLGVQPSRVRESKIHTWSKERGPTEKLSFTWMLDSPKGHTDGDPTARLYALADLIMPFAGRLQSLEERFKPLVDVVYHITPQHPHSITGEFDWFVMPAELMRRFAAWNLSISYECFWFDHPDWARSRSPGLFKRVLDWMWSRPNPQGEANGSRPSRPEEIQTSAAAACRRTP